MKKKIKIVLIAILMMCSSLSSCNALKVRDYSNNKVLIYKEKDIEVSIFINLKGILLEQKVDFKNGYSLNREWDTTGFLKSDIHYYNKQIIHEKYFFEGILNKEAFFNKNSPDSLKKIVESDDSVLYFDTLKGSHFEILSGRYLEFPRHDIYREWYKNGQLKIEGNYDNGKKIGIWKTYDMNGALLKEINYNR